MARMEILTPSKTVWLAVLAFGLGFYAAILFGSLKDWDSVTLPSLFLDTESAAVASPVINSTANFDDDADSTTSFDDDEDDDDNDDDGATASFDELASSRHRVSRRVPLAVVTVVRDFGDDFEESLQSIWDEHQGNRTLVKRFQLLHVAELSRQVESINRKNKARFADLIIVTNPAGLSRKDIRHFLQRGARVEVVEAGFEMRALWSLDGYSDVFYLRPGARLRPETSLYNVWKYLHGKKCILRASSTTASETPPRRNRRNLSERRRLSEDPAVSLPDLLWRRRLEEASATSAKKAPPINVDALPRMSVPLVDWASDSRMRPVLSLWIQPKPALYRDDPSRPANAGHYDSSSLGDCTTGIMAGYAPASLRCSLTRFILEIPPEELVRGSTSDGEYPLPIEYAWKKSEVEKVSGALARWLYGNLELGEAKACAKDFQVRKLMNVAKAQLADVKEPPRRATDGLGPYAHQLMVLKTHKLNNRVNQTAHAWAESVVSKGGEVSVSFQGQPDSNDYANLLSEQKRGTGFGLMLVNASGAARHVVPYEAIETYNRACKIEFAPFLCDRASGVPALKRMFRGEGMFMWLFTAAASMVIFSHVFDSRPDLEYLWLFDYDVVYTGRLAELFDRVAHDDSDLLAVSFAPAPTPEGVVKKKAPSDVSIWKVAAGIWQPRLRISRVNAGALRLSRRMIRWALESAFVPLNWVVDEVFFFDVCERRRPSCKYSPFQLFDLVEQERTFHPANSENYTKFLVTHGNDKPFGKLRHPVKDKNWYPALEPWLHLHP